MKALLINYEYYLFPEGVSSLEGFIAYANKHFNEFVKLTWLDRDNCRQPYFIEEDVKTVYMNLSQVESVRECEIKAILPREEYKERLKKIVSEKCVHCTSYRELPDPEENLGGHWNNISLDGDCYAYETKEEK